eukprot:3891524-Ditylum_brightwellii.AAC.1
MENNDGDNLTVKKENSLNDTNNNTLIDDADNTQLQSLNQLHKLENGEIMSTTVVWDASMLHSPLEQISLLRLEANCYPVDPDNEQDDT